MWLKDLKIVEYFCVFWPTCIITGTNISGNKKLEVTFLPTTTITHTRTSMVPSKTSKKN